MENRVSAFVKQLWFPVWRNSCSSIMYYGKKGKIHSDTKLGDFKLSITRHDDKILKKLQGWLRFFPSGAASHRCLLVVLGVQNFLPTHCTDSWSENKRKGRAMWAVVATLLTSHRPFQCQIFLKFNEPLSQNTLYSYKYTGQKPLTILLFLKSFSHSARSSVITFLVCTALTVVWSSLMYWALTDPAGGEACLAVGVKPARKMQHRSKTVYVPRQQLFCVSVQIKTNHNHSIISSPSITIYILIYRLSFRTHLAFLEVRSLFSFSLRPPPSERRKKKKLQ